MLQTARPAEWPQAFGVLARETEQETSGSNQGATSALNLEIVYYPPSGAVGVTLPVPLEQVTVERLNAVSLVSIGSQFDSPLVSVKSFAQAPDLGLAASDLMDFDPSEAVPEITLEGTPVDGTAPLQWNPERDLLGSAESDRVFVVEIESDGTARLRFATPLDPGSTSGQTNGLVPDSGTQFVANYRIGNGTAGNVGAESLVYLAAADARIQSCINPLPASGGTDPETNDQIRRRAPQAFLSQEPSTLQRAVTMADYEAVAEANPQVDQAVASLRWTGSWYSVFLAVEPKSGGNLTSTLQKSLKQTVERYRFAGQDLKLESPQYVSLQIELQVCVDPSYFQSQVEQSLLQVLGNQILPNGQKGAFYPDNFTFGQTVYLSPVYAAARSVPGVVSVTATQFQPQGVNTTQYLAAGQIKLGSLQVARLENDPSFPDHGQLVLVMQGGK
jgi:predicted phage baseplate assembly protein